MIGLGIAQAVIASHGHAWAAVGWIAGLATFVVVTAVAESRNLLLRVGSASWRGSTVAPWPRSRARCTSKLPGRRRARPDSASGASTPSPTTRSKPPDRTARVTTPRVAIDVGSLLHGPPQTGVGQFVARLARTGWPASTSRPTCCRTCCRSAPSCARRVRRRCATRPRRPCGPWGRLRPAPGRPGGWPAARSCTDRTTSSRRAHSHHRVGARLLVPAAARRGHGSGSALPAPSCSAPSPAQGDGPRCRSQHTAGQVRELRSKGRSQVAVVRAGLLSPTSLPARDAPIAPGRPRRPSVTSRRRSAPGEPTQERGRPPGATFGLLQRQAAGGWRLVLLRTGRPRRARPSTTPSAASLRGAGTTSCSSTT